MIETSSPARRAWALRGGLCLVAIAVFAAAAPSEVGAAQPTLEQIEQVVRDQLSRNRNYQPGDLISRTDIEPVINRLLEMGIEPAEREELYDAFLPHNSFLVCELSTPAGRRFMRKVAQLPGVYDRLERLSWMPAGREMIRDLINRPDGPEVLKSLTTPEGAKAVEKLMGDDVRGKNFALPTGHIHTADDLLERLRASHAGRGEKPSS